MAKTFSHNEICALRESLGLSLTEACHELSQLNLIQWIELETGLKITSDIIELFSPTFILLNELYRLRENLVIDIINESITNGTPITVFSDMSDFVSVYPGKHLLSYRIYNSAAKQAYLKTKDTTILIAFNHTTHKTIPIPDFENLPAITNNPSHLIN